MNSSNKYIIWGVVVVVIGAVGIWFWRGGSPGTTITPAGTTSTSTDTGAPAVPATGASNPPAQIVISITSPAAGDVWKLGATNTITWIKAPGVTGYVYLINAVTKNLVGVITPQIGPQQTSYPWNTEHLSLSRTDPSQKDAVAGTYFVSMGFDGNNLPIISSPTFTIVN
jgi:hypothetical protein